MPERDETENSDVDMHDVAFQQNENNGIAPVAVDSSASTSLSRNGVEVIHDNVILESIAWVLDEGSIADDTNICDDEDDDKLVDDSEHEVENEILSDYDTDIDLES